MTELTWDREYELIRKDTAFIGVVEQRNNLVEKRKHPRFKFLFNIQKNGQEFKYSVHDVSVSGLSFNCDTYFESGFPLMVKWGDHLELPTDVVFTTRTSLDPVYVENRYRVHCRFLEELERPQFVALLKDFQTIVVQRAQ